MIYYLTSSQNAALMQDFLDGFGSALARRIAVVNYQSLISGETARVPTGTYVFTSFGQSLGELGPARDLKRDLGFTERALGADNALRDGGFRH